ncbi:arginine repressor [Vallitalea okinawensis]|uniref:arginine repressor n=1 Tax=Vallitalea okinawensis TaxID=2078660 RepID=UPI000CFB5462|nr:arginine repressor [Vallitalea okinawensis]
MKLARQSKIIELINNHEIETQEELAKMLMDSGFFVTQATVSRDIRELKLTKVQSENGSGKYAILKEQEKNFNERFINVLIDGYDNMDKAQNLVIVRTLQGMAMAVAAAIDALDFKEIVGSIAGDDTIFLATRSENDAVNLMEKINRVVNSNH